MRPLTCQVCGAPQSDRDVLAHAARLRGQRGGKATSDAKREACRRNAKLPRKAGRPRPQSGITESAFLQCPPSRSAAQ